MKLITACPACSASDSRRLIHVVTKSVPAEDNLVYVYCDRCGLVYAQQVTQNRDDLDDVYVTPYAGLDHDEFLLDGEFRLERNRYRKKWLDRQLQSLGRGFLSRKALEIGAKDGSFLWLLKQEGWQVLGIDPNENYSRLARHHYGIEIRNEYFREGLLSDQSFDLVAFFHLVEHMEDPTTFLRAVRAVLRNRGLVYLETPNLHCLQQRQFIKTHWIFYSRNTLNQTLEHNGFRVLAVTATLPGPMTFDQLGVLAEAYDGAASSRWQRGEDFSAAKAMLERALQDDFPYSALTLSNRLFRLARSVLRDRHALAMKRLYRSVQSKLRGQKLAKASKNGPETLANLPEPAKQAFLHGFVNKGHLVEIARLPDEFVQLKVLARIKAYRLSAKQTHELVEKELVTPGEAPLS